MFGKDAQHLSLSPGPPPEPSLLGSANPLNFSILSLHLRAMPTLIHPLLVHFPIALLCTATLWSWLGKRQADTDIAWRLWCFGTAAAVLACIAGIMEYLPHRRGALASTLMEHQLWGLGVSVSALAWAMWRAYQQHLGYEDPGSKTPGKLVSTLICTGVLMAAAGGGSLVLEHGVGLLQSFCLW